MSLLCAEHTFISLAVHQRYLEVSVLEKKSRVPSFHFRLALIYAQRLASAHSTDQYSLEAERDAECSNQLSLAPNQCDGSERRDAGSDARQRARSAYGNARSQSVAADRSGTRKKFMRVLRSAGELASQKKCDHLKLFCMIEATCACVAVCRSSCQTRRNSGI